MDNFLKGECDEFIQEKSIEIFNKLNQTALTSQEVTLEKTPLSGISNTIYMIKISLKKGNSSENTRLSIQKIFFKIFGRISVLVNRELETFIMTKLHSLSMGPKIYETDMKTYRIEEFVENCDVMSREMMLSDLVLPKITKIFSSINGFGDYNYYFDYVGEESKITFFHKLKQDEKTNFVNFTVNKMLPMGLESMKIFKEKYYSDQERDPVLFDENKLFKMDHILTNFEDYFYDVCPDQGLFVINHNDAHPLNILKSQNFEQIYLCDFEYSSYNLIGFDIANYIIESFFLLTAEIFPFYQTFTQKNFCELSEDRYYNIYLDFFEIFENEHASDFRMFNSFSKLLEKCKTRDYFYRVMGMSSLMWFVFAVIYFNYDSIKSKNAYDYFNFAYDRLDVYDGFVKNNIK
jgi:thiamine kinase-like enzyme